MVAHYASVYLLVNPVQPESAFMRAQIVAEYFR
jgi:hypothetical protein